MVGDEILDGFTQDTNSHWMLQRLRGLGHHTRWVKIIRDHPPQIAEVVSNALREAELGMVFLCGGLGPTPDDRTFAALAQALDVDLVVEPNTREQIDNKIAEFRARNRMGPGESNEGHRKMALLPAGWTEVITNRAGMAPCPVYHAGNPPKLLFVLPGVPIELRTTWAEELEPNWLSGAARPPHVQEVNFAGAIEGRFYTVLTELETTFPMVRMGSYPNFETHVLTIRATGADAVQVDAAINLLLARMAQVGIKPLT